MYEEGGLFIYSIYLFITLKHTSLEYKNHTTTVVKIKKTTVQGTHKNINFQISNNYNPYSKCVILHLNIWNVVRREPVPWVGKPGLGLQDSMHSQCVSVIHWPLPPVTVTVYNSSLDCQCSVLPRTQPLTSSCFR